MNTYTVYSTIVYAIEIEAESHEEAIDFVENEELDEEDWSFVSLSLEAEEATDEDFSDEEEDEDEE
jgi:hypothetical protein